MVLRKKYGGIEVYYHLKNGETINDSFVIYLLKFPNGKYYVGQTKSKHGLYDRIKNHCSEITRKSDAANIVKNRILSKYKRMDVFILSHCKTTDELNEMEVFHINVLKRKIVNFESGGQKNKELSETTKVQISNTLKDYYHKNRKKNEIEVYDVSGNKIMEFYGIRDAMNYFSKSLRVIWAACTKDYIFLKKYQLKYKNRKKVIFDYSGRVNLEGNLNKKYFYLNGKQIDKLFKYDQNKKFVGEFRYANISKDDKKNVRESLSKNCFYNGYFWSNKLLTAEEIPQTRDEKVSKIFSRPILQLNDDLIVIKEWPNAKEATAFYNVAHENIRMVCKRKRRHCAGYVWCYKDEYEWFKENWDKPLLKR